MSSPARRSPPATTRRSPLARRRSKPRRAPQRRRPRTTLFDCSRPGPRANRRPCIFRATSAAILPMGSGGALPPGTPLLYVTSAPCEDSHGPHVARASRETFESNPFAPHGGGPRAGRLLLRPALGGGQAHPAAQRRGGSPGGDRVDPPAGGGVGQ